MKGIISLILMFALPTMLPSFAQTSLTSQEQESIQVVAVAIKMLGELNSYTIHLEQKEVQAMEIIVGQQTITSTSSINQIIDFQVAKTDDGYNGSGTVVHEIKMQAAGDYRLTFELVLLNGEGYIRASGDTWPPSSVPPEKWLNLNDPAVRSDKVLRAFTFETLTQYFKVVLPVDEAGILNIKKLNNSEIDGQSMQVFLFDVNHKAAENNDTKDTYTAYIGLDDGLLHQLDNTTSFDTTINIQGDKVPLAVVMESSTNFSHFNEPVTITLSTLESSK